MAYRLPLVARWDMWDGLGVDKPPFRLDVQQMSFAKGGVCHCGTPRALDENAVET